MKKEFVKQFDLKAAFKALDEIEIPVVKGILPHREDLKETFTKKLATEVLVEDFYDVNSKEDLEAAQEEREAEIAKAKLARIEKIVDLDAESEEDLLPSYVGKVIVQCPQCMTLFYKNQEDIEKSEENPEVVNINEICQHCGNSSGYTLIGKVDTVGENEAENYDVEDFSDEELNIDENELNLDFPESTEEVDPEGTGEAAVEEEEPVEETSEEDLTSIEETEEETSEEESEEEEEEVKESLNEDLEEETTEEEIPAEEEPVEDEILLNIEDIKDIAAEAGEAVADATQQEIADEIGNTEVVKELDTEVIKEITDEIVDNAISELEVIEDEVSEEEVIEEEPVEEVKESLVLTEDWDSRVAEADKVLLDIIKKSGNENFDDGDGYWCSEDEWCDRYLYYTNAISNLETVENLCAQYSTEDCQFYVFDDDSEEDPVSEIGYILKPTPTDEALNEDLNEDKKLSRLKDCINKMINRPKSGNYSNHGVVITDNVEKIKALIPEEIKVVLGSEFKNLSIEEQHKLIVDAAKGTPTIYIIEADKEDIFDPALTNKAWFTMNITSKINEDLDEDKLTLTEDVDKDLDAKLKAHNEYIEYLKEMIEKEEKSLANAKNDFVKKSIQSRIDALKADLEAALPEALKGEIEPEELPTPEEAEIKDATENKEEPKEETKESLTESIENEQKLDKFEHDLKTGKEPVLEDSKELLKAFADNLTEETSEKKVELVEDSNYEVSDAEFKAMLNDPVFNEDLKEKTEEIKEEVELEEDADGLNMSALNTAISRLHALAAKEEKFADIEDLDENLLNEKVTNYLKEVYSNVATFTVTACNLEKANTLVVEGVISFNSGNIKNTKFIFENVEDNKLIGLNEDLTNEKAFTLNYSITDKVLMTESFEYKYTIENTLVEGLK